MNQAAINKSVRSLDDKQDQKKAHRPQDALNVFCSVIICGDKGGMPVNPYNACLFKNAIAKKTKMEEMPSTSEVACGETYFNRGNSV